MTITLVSSRVIDSFKVITVNYFKDEESSQLIDPYTRSIEVGLRHS